MNRTTLPKRYSSNTPTRHRNALLQAVEGLEARTFFSGSLLDKVAPPAPTLPVDPLNGSDKHALPGLPPATKGPKKGPGPQGSTPPVTQTSHPRGGQLLFDDSKVVELAPETIDPRTGISPPHMSGRVADPADIVWVNRGLASDNFATTFGTFAAQARSVVDAVIVRYEQMINSFDYASAGQTYSLTLSMGAAGGGFGASANLSTSLGGKPKSGSITMGSGTGTGTNTDHGWFLDPTPFDNSEFVGNITNAFSGDAQAGSPAENKGDFFTVVAAEMTHCMGLFGAALTGWTSHVTNTGIHDAQTGVGNFWVFQGPSVSHLGTSDNAGSSDFGSYIHSAEGSSAINFGGQFWRGADDQGNAFYEFGRRYLINNIFSLMFRDAYGYLSVNPASNAGTFYATLESNGTLLVRGGDFAGGHTPSNDLIVLSSSGGNITVSVDVGSDVGGSGPTAGDQNLGAFVSTFPASAINNIQIFGGAGNDIIRIDGNGGKNTFVNGGDGDDFTDFSFNTRNLSTATGGTTVNGGAGNDQIFTYDDGQTAAQTYTITDARFDRPGWGGFFYDVDIEGVNLWAGQALDTVNVQSTFVGQPLFIQNAGNNDVINVGNGTTGVQNIASDVIITNAPAFSTVNINDTGNSVPRNSAYVYRTSDLVYGFVASLAPATVYYKLADTGPVNITTGSGADSLVVYANRLTMNLNSAGGIDRVQIGDASVGGLPLITGAITVNNSPSFTDLVVTDAGDNVAKSANMDFAGSNAFGRVTNLAPVPIVWNNNDIFSVTVITGNANDTMLLYSDTETLNYDSAGGNDTIFMGSNSVGGLQFISGLVSVDNTTGATIVVVDDLGATVTKTSVSVTHPAGSYTNVTGFAPGTLRFADSGLTQVQLRSGTISAIQPDRFDVQATGVPLFFFNNGGNDAVNLGGGPLGADSLLAPVTVSGTPGSTSVGLLDYGQANPRNMTLDDDNVFATLSGFGAFDHTFNLQTITSMAFSMGQGADVLNINRARRPITYNNLHAGDATDVINIGNATNGLNDIQTNIDGGILQSPVAISLDDTVNSANRTYTFQPQFIGTTLTGNRIVFNGVNYVGHTFGASTESVSISAGSGNDTFNVPVVRTTPVYLNGAAGNDTFNLGTHTTQVSDPIYLLGDGGLDVLNVNADNGSTASATLLTTMHFSNVNIGTGGNLTVAGGGDKLLSTKALTLGSNAKVDLVDNDMILDYTGATQLPAVQTLINSMRNGGAWNGTRGITSSAAAGASPANQTLGALEASAFIGIYGAGATFAGDPLDSTMVLVKHTYYGDTDFNGVVNFDDYSRTDAGFNGNRSGWLNGDFDGNGVVNFDDYSLIDLAFNTQGAAL